MNYYLKVLQNYAVFSGRARRSEYWYFILFSFIASFTLEVIGGLIEMPIINSIYSFAILIPATAVGVRRMHDVGKSGWFLLIPFYNIVLLCTEGTQEDNEYGTNPKHNPTA
jgi:uncharacterized membrane protein YhaH (DUF805 family)